MDLVVTTREDLEQMIGDAVANAMAKFHPLPAREVRYDTVANTAKRLGVAPLTIYRGVKDGRIPSKTIGRLIKIPTSYME